MTSHHSAEVLVDHAAQPIARLLLAHGAGAPMDSSYMAQLAKLLAQQGIEVWRFHFDYMAKSVAGKKQPPAKMSFLVQEMSAMIGSMPADLPLFIGGKSMGGRVATLLATDAAAVLPVQGVLAFGYPFCPPAKKQLGIAPRTTHFAALLRPLLIVQGERDAFGGPADLAQSGWPKVSINWLAGGDHDLKTLKRHSQTQDQLLAQASVLAATFIQHCLGALSTRSE